MLCKMHSEGAAGASVLFETAFYFYFFSFHVLPACLFVALLMLLLLMPRGYSSLCGK